jgi:hypothetical protein
MPSKNKQPLVKCRNCANLLLFRDPSGVQCRCAFGFYDVDSGVPGSFVIKRYFSAMSLKSDNVTIWRALNKCNIKGHYVTAATEMPRR